MTSRYAIWRGIRGRMAVRLIALMTLALALAGPLAMGVAPVASAMGASSTICGMASSAKSGCGPPFCAPVTANDYALPTTSPRGGVRASLSRTGGVSGSTDTLTGSGWPAGATVEIFLGSRSQGRIQVAPTSFAQGRADASGHVIIAGFHTPGVEECLTKDGQQFGDNQALFVAQTPDARARVSLLFTFFPSPALGPISATSAVMAGQVIMLGGSGWEPGQTVTITPAFHLWPTNGDLASVTPDFHQLPADATTVFAQSDGTFMTGATIPQEPPETQIAFFATADGPRNGQVSLQMNAVFSVLPSVLPTLALGHSAGQAGDTDTVTGTNWPAGQDILIAYCGGQVTLCPGKLSEQLASVNADERGRITATIRIPTGALPGPITVQAGPLTSPFDATILTRTQSFIVQYPFAQAHPRLELALRALPYAIMALLVALIALGEWLATQRRGPGLAARQ
jgi:hypothetical protein